MGKDRIKVIKRLKVSEAEQSKSFTENVKNERNIRHKLGKVVKDWIAERQENSRIEKLFSESKILAWQIPVPNVYESIK